MMIAAPAAPVHWTTYVQTFAVIASTIGTFVYVYFTYHIMKWAVGQGQAAIDQMRRKQSLIDTYVQGTLAGDLFRLFAFSPRLDGVSTEEYMAELLRLEAMLTPMLINWEHLLEQEISTSLREPLMQACSVLRGAVMFLKEREWLAGGNFAKGPATIMSYVRELIERLNAIQKSEYNTRITFDDMRDKEHLGNG
jgi:hypothetical protein